MNEVLIIGAGLSGLMAARKLQTNGIDPILIDKGRSVGGRMATRRIGGGLADHGAQFFTVRTQQFRDLVETWLDNDWIYEWSRGWSDGSLKITMADGHPRYVARGGMNQLTKHLAAGLEDRIHLNTRITSLTVVEDGWILEDEGGQNYHSQSVLVTMPVPQALELLRDSGMMFSPKDRDALERIQFGPCLAGLFVVDGVVDLPEPGALQNFKSPIYWIADNQRKGISQERVITLHAGAAFSRTHWEDDDETILQGMRKVLNKHLREGAQITEEQLKRWRYSVPLTTHPHEYLLAEGLPTLVFAGDAFGGRGRVEGAVLSGLAAADVLIDNL